MPCFERCTDGSRVDVGFGSGVVLARPFRGIWEREDKLFRRVIVRGRRGKVEG